METKVKCHGNPIQELLSPWHLVARGARGVAEEHQETGAETRTAVQRPHDTHSLSLPLSLFGAHSWMCYEAAAGPLRPPIRPPLTPCCFETLPLETHSCNDVTHLCPPLSALSPPPSHNTL